MAYRGRFSMDYAAWASRASQFLRGLTRLPGDLVLADGIEPPGRDAYTQDWLRSTECGLPPELKAFVSTASRSCSFRYRWKPPPPLQARLGDLRPGLEELIGGAHLCDSYAYENYDHRQFFQQELPSLARNEGMTPQAGSILEEWMKSATLDPERAYGRVALVTLESGARISLELKATDESRPVVWVDPADPAKRQVISPSFDRFLLDWEQLCYLTPSPENLAAWLDPETGRLNLNRGDAVRLREILTASAQPSKDQILAPSEGRYSAWIQRAESFVRNLDHLPGQWGITVARDRQVTQSEADDLAKVLPLGLPASLCDLYTQGAATCRLQYHWSPPEEDLPQVEAVIPYQRSFCGGPRFIAWDQLLDAHAIHDWWEDEDADYTQEQVVAHAIWRRTIPFLDVGNGDYVALRVTDKHGDMPVVYLCHDDPDEPVTVLSPNLDRFLTDWESLCYIGPEIWLLAHFLGDDGDEMLNAEQANVDQWRKLLLGDRNTAP